MARGLLAALRGDDLDPERFAFALALADALHLVREIERSTAQTASYVKAVVEGLSAR